MQPQLEVALRCAQIDTRCELESFSCMAMAVSNCKERNCAQKAFSRS
jgi:hypothetical protein